MARAVFSKKHDLLTRELDLNKEATSKVLIWKIALCGGETLALRKVDQKYRKSFEVWCWRRMEKIILTDCVRNEVLHRV